MREGDVRRAKRVKTLHGTEGYRVLRWSAANELHIRIDDVLPLAEVQEAHRRLEGRKTQGKLLLVP